MGLGVEAACGLAFMHGRALQLDGGVLDRHREVCSDAEVDVFEDPQRVGGFEALLADHDVGRDDGQVTADRGGMQVVNVLDVIQGEDVLANLIEIDPLGGVLHEDVHRRAQDAERSGHDQRSDEQPCQSVGLLESGELDDQRGRDDAERSEGIVEDLEERGAHVQAGVLPPGQDEDRSDVRDQPEPPEGEQLPGRDLGGLGQPRDALDCCIGSHHDQEGGLGQGGQHFDAGESPGALAAGRAQHHGRRDQGHQQPRDIDQRVCRVGEQSKASGDDTAEGLREHDDRRNAKRDRQANPGRVR